LEHSLKTNGIIFLTNGHLNVGMLCRASRKLIPGAGGPDDLAGWGFVVEGLERGVAVSVPEADGFLSAEISTALEPDRVPDEGRLKELDKEVRSLLGEVHSLLPKEGESWWQRRYSQDTPIPPEVERLFNVQDIVSPSLLADRAAFLLYLLGMLSTEQQREVAETFRPDHRLHVLSKVLIRATILPEEEEVKRLKELLLKSAERFSSSQLRQVSAGAFARDGRLPYVGENILLAVGSVIRTLFFEAGEKFKHERDATLSKSAREKKLKTASDIVARKNKKWSKRRFDINSDNGRPPNWDKSELSHAIDEAMDAVMRLPNGEGISQYTVVEMLNKLYPAEKPMTESGLKTQLKTHKINWKEKRKAAQVRMKSRAGKSS
jgi:hypothetical protein